MITHEDATDYVAENVERLMVSLGMTKAELARKCKTHKMAMTRLLARTHEPTAHFLNNLAEALGTTVDALLEPPAEKNIRRRA